MEVEIMLLVILAVVLAGLYRARERSNAVRQLWTFFAIGFVVALSRIVMKAVS
jgi:hypothetical protein